MTMTTTTRYDTGRTTSEADDGITKGHVVRPNRNNNRSAICQGPSRLSSVRTRAPGHSFLSKPISNPSGGKQRERSDVPGVCCGHEDLYGNHDDCDANPCTSSKPGAMPVDTAPEPRDMILMG
jgi:hypothetical protein